MKKLYEWVLSWSKTPYGSIVLFFIAFFEAIIFPIPPDILLIALVLGSRRKAYQFALICILGSLLGASFGYLIGDYFWQYPNNAYKPTAEFFFNNVPGFSKAAFLKIQEQYDKYGFLIIFTAGFTPIPYKIFTITAGVFNISFSLFIISSLVSRSLRYTFITLLIYLYGKKIRSFIDKYFNLLSIIFTILLIGGYVIMKVIFLH